MPLEAMALVQAFSELVPGVPCSDETLKSLLAHFWKPGALLRHNPEDNLLLEIEHHARYKRKRGGGTELINEFVSFYVFLLQDPVGSHGYRPRRVLYHGHVDSRDDTDAFLKNLMEMRRILRVVRAGGLCSCGERLKVEKASLCAPCACKAFFK